MLDIVLATVRRPALMGKTLGGYSVSTNLRRSDIGPHLANGSKNSHNNRLNNLFSRNLKTPGKCLTK